MDSPATTRALDGVNQICVVDGESLPLWNLSFPSTNYRFTRFTCIFFLLLEYMFFYKTFCVPCVFLLSASQHYLIQIIRTVSYFKYSSLQFKAFQLNNVKIINLKKLMSKLIKIRSPSRLGL